MIKINLAHILRIYNGFPNSPTQPYMTGICYLLNAVNVRNKVFHIN